MAMLTPAPVKTTIFGLIIIWYYLLRGRPSHLAFQRYEKFRQYSKQAYIFPTFCFEMFVYLTQGAIFVANINIGFMKRLLKNLGVWILIAMAVGIVVGIVMGPDAAMRSAPTQ